MVLYMMKHTSFLMKDSSPIGSGWITIWNPCRIVIEYKKRYRMWKKFKWDMFVTSFIPLWISIVIVDVWTIVCFILENWNRKGALSDNLINVLYGNCIQLVSIAVISILVLVSIIGINSFLTRNWLRIKSIFLKARLKKQRKLTNCPLSFYLHIFCRW